MERYHARPSRLPIPILRALLRPTALILASLAALAACTTVTTDVRTGPEEKWRYTIIEPKRENSPDGPDGELSYRGRDLQPYFTTVVVGERSFDYVVQIDRSDFHGYRMTGPGGTPIGAGDASAPADPGTISQGELDKKWYFAPIHGRKEGTPETWVWVKRLNVEAFVAPNRISRLAEVLELNPVDGRLDQEPQSGVSLGIRFTTVF